MQQQYKIIIYRLNNRKISRKKGDSASVTFVSDDAQGIGVVQAVTEALLKVSAENIKVTRP